MSDDVYAKITKLLRVARSASNPHEADTARQAAHKLASEAGLTIEGLRTHLMAKAYDDLVAEIKDKVGKKIPLSSEMFNIPEIVHQVISSASNASADDKASRFKTVVRVVDFADLLMGSNPSVSQLKTLTDTLSSQYNLDNMINGDATKP